MKAVGKPKGMAKGMPKGMVKMKELFKTKGGNRGRC